MNKTQIYEQWLEQKRAVNVTPPSADRVMTALHRATQRKPASPWGQWVAAPWTQAGLTFGALLVFVLRFVALFATAVG